MKPTTKFTLMLSGGSLPSTSLTCDARMVSVQLSPVARLGVGSMVKLVAGPALAVAAIGPPVMEHVNVNQFPVTLTGSLKVTVRLASTGNCEVLSGKVLVIDGALSGVHE